jgi:hypothetical protein
LPAAVTEPDAKGGHRAKEEDGGQKRERAPAKPPASPGHAACVRRVREPEDLLDARIDELVRTLRVVSPLCLHGVPRQHDTGSAPDACFS